MLYICWLSHIYLILESSIKLSDGANFGLNQTEATENLQEHLRAFLRATWT